MILSEDSGLNITVVNVSREEAKIEIDWEVNGTINNTIANWYDIFQAYGDLNTTITRVGLADYYLIYTLNSSYERCTPCVLNFTKVEKFFNTTWWNDSNRFNRQVGDQLWRNISRLIGLGGSSLYHFNVSLRYLNETVYTLIDDNGNTIECQIGYPIPKSGEVAKFERLVVIDKEVMGCLNIGGRGDCINENTIKRLVVYVW
jgi:hypothetical protein